MIVYLKGIIYGCIMNEEGIYYFYVLVGKYMLVVLVIGYKIIEKFVILVYGERIKMNVMIVLLVIELGEVVVVFNGVFCVKCFVFNVIVVDIKEF